MSGRRIAGCVVSASLMLLAGCHHRVPARTTVTPPPLAPAAGPVVMVSVPPPTHHSSDFPGEVPTTSNIPVVKPVKPPKRLPRRSQPSTPPATVTAPPAATPPPAAAAATPTAAQTLGQLTASTNDPAATRAGAAEALRHEHDRFVAIPGAVQASHQSEFDQARRFLKSASDALEASDFVGALALTTKARVLLDDLSR